MTKLPAPLQNDNRQLESQSRSRRLNAIEFQGLADVPSEIEWFANLGNSQTRRAYENALQDFMRFTGIVRPDEFRTVEEKTRFGILRTPRRVRGHHTPVKCQETACCPN